MPTRVSERQMIPGMTGSDDPQYRRFNVLMDELTLDKGDAEAMLTHFLEDIEWALYLHKTMPGEPFSYTTHGSFMALETCVKELPSGQEEGLCTGVDVGGTNMRVTQIELKGDGSWKVQDQRQSSFRDIPSKRNPAVSVIHRDATAADLFDAFGTFINQKLIDGAIPDAPAEGIPAGLCFSFGIQLKDVDKAILLDWSKEIATGRSHEYSDQEKCIGRDVVHMMNEGVLRTMPPGVLPNHQTRIKAVLNDTIGTMVTAAYQKKPDAPACVCGIIVGTGFNIAYMEPEANQYGYLGKAINLESGGFRHAPMTRIDMVLDAQTNNRGGQLMEKQISGLYLGELFRLAAVDIFTNNLPERWFQRAAIDTAVMPALYESTEEESLGYVREKLGWNDATKAQALMMKAVVTALFRRSAFLVAVCLTAIGHRTRKMSKSSGGFTVGIDGSVYVRNKFYQTLVKEHIDLIVPGGSHLINLQEAHDGSGIGAAILAALYK